MTAARVLPVLGMLSGAALTAILLAGCERPTSLHFAPTNVSGTWSVNAQNVTGSGMTCDVTDLTVHLAQNGDGTFTGTAITGTLVCVYMGTQTAQAVAGLSVTGNVNVPARTIGIDVPVDSATLSGSVDQTNSFMNGTTQLVLGVGGGTNVTITGPWTATRTGN
jgi:hypothetical protein